MKEPKKEIYWPECSTTLLFRWYKMSRQQMYVTLQNDKRFDSYDKKLHVLQIIVRT